MGHRGFQEVWDKIEGGTGGMGIKLNGSMGVGGRGAQIQGA